MFEVIVAGDFEVNFFTKLVSRRFIIIVYAFLNIYVVFISADDLVKEKLTSFRLCQALGKYFL